MALKLITYRIAKIKNIINKFRTHQVHLQEVVEKLMQHSHFLSTVKVTVYLALSNCATNRSTQFFAGGTSL